MVQKSHAEAAARLSLLMEFDINQFDAFCLCLEGELGGYSVSVKNLGQNRTQQYDLLCEWILEIGTFLIRPVVEASPEQYPTTPSTELRPDLRVEQRFPFLVKKVLKARVWEDSEYALFRRLQVARPLVQASCSCFLHSAVVDSHWNSISIKYFSGEIMTRIFCVQGIAATFMEEIGMLCDRRFAALSAEPGGDDLVSFRFVTSDDTSYESAIQGELSSKNG